MLKHSKSGDFNKNSMLIINNEKFPKSDKNFENRLDLIRKANSNQINVINKNTAKLGGLYVEADLKADIKFQNKLTLLNNTQVDSVDGNNRNTNMLDMSSSKDLELFLEEERKVQQQFLDKNALNLDELEDLLRESHNKPEVIQENINDSVKLNLLNVINNDRIANQLVEDDLIDESSKHEDAYHAKGISKIANQGVTLSTTQDAEVTDSYHRMNRNLASHKVMLTHRMTDNKNKNSDKKSSKRHKAYQKTSKLGSGKVPILGDLLSDKRREVIDSNISELQSVSLKSNVRYSENPMRKSGSKYLSISIIGNKSMKHKVDFKERKSTSPSLQHSLSGK